MRTGLNLASADVTFQMAPRDLRLTDYLAIYAAILSTFIFGWNFWSSRTRVRIRFMPGLDSVDGDAQTGAYVSIQNCSSHTVHLAALSILYPYRKKSIAHHILHTVKYRRWP